MSDVFKLLRELRAVRGFKSDMERMGEALTINFNLNHEGGDIQLAVDHPLTYELLTKREGQLLRMLDSYRDDVVALSALLAEVQPKLTIVGIDFAKGLCQHCGRKLVDGICTNCGG